MGCVNDKYERKIDADDDLSSSNAMHSYLPQTNSNSNLCRLIGKQDVLENETSDAISAPAKCLY
jgi:hypothetical protein